MINLSQLKLRLKNYLISYPYNKYIKWIEIEVLGHLSKGNKKLKNLTTDEIKEIKAFTSPYYTTSGAFHDFYKQHTGKFYTEYIPDDIYFTKIDPFYNDWVKALKFDDKCYYEHLLCKSNMRLPQTICYRINGFCLNNDYKSISKEQAINLIIDQKKAFLKKSISSSGGKGVRYFDIDEFQDVETAKTSLNNIIEDLGDNIIVQKPIEQSKSLAILNPSSVNTLRILSMIRPNGKIKICSSIVRMGRNGKKVDNASSGGITCGINPDGSLKDVAFSTNGEKYYSHPDTGVKFNKITIPLYSEIIDLVTQTHPHLPNFRLISWDIAIDKSDKPILIELNLCCGELDFHQLNNGPVFGEDTQEILEEVFNSH